MRGRGRRRAAPLAVALLTAVAAPPGPAATEPVADTARAPWSACRLKGLPQAARCGHVSRPLDPSRPDGVRIDVHFAMLPALSRHKADEPVFVFAGGPGQSAIALAGTQAQAYARLNQRRDLVFVDLRGTGRSAPLACADDAPDTAATLTLAERLDTAAQPARLRACLQRLQALPYGDLRWFTTPLAAADVDAVRAVLGAARIDALGTSYGTRAVLEYLRQFPQRLRRAVLDGVAPADMRLPDAASADNQAAFDGWLADCAATPACHAAWPDLATRWQALLAGLPRTVDLPHPVSGLVERVMLQRDAVLGWVRAPLYVPALAAALPAAVGEATAGRFGPLAALASAVSAPGRDVALYTGLHLSVVCTEDVDGAPPDAAARGRDFGDSFARRYREACADWPRGTLPAGYRRTPAAPGPVWLLSGGLDPVTPPRHAGRVLEALGKNARHTIVPHAGHGVAGLSCMREAVQRFIAAERDDEALALAGATDCAGPMPRPPAFVPPAPPSPGAAASEVRR